MSNQIEIFKNEQFGEIRTVMRQDEPWFVGKDICVSLGYSNPRKALDDHVCSEDKYQGDGVTIRDSMGREQRPTIINESGVYALIFGSKLPKAQDFKHWVTSEVLPTIRKHGVYMTPETLEKSMCNPNFLFDVVSKLKDEYNKRIELEGQVKQLNEENEVMKPKAEYCDGVLQSKNSFTTTQIAADVGLSARRLNKILHEKKIQYKVNGQWILYQEYKDKGYVQAQTHLISLPNGDTMTTMSTEWTQKGSRFIYDLLKDDGIVPIREVQSEAVC